MFGSCNRQICLFYSQKMMDASEALLSWKNSEGSEMEITSHRNSTCYAALAACVAAAGAMPMALAAENKAPTTEQQSTLSEIVVTAQYRQQNLQDTPIAITAVTAEMIEQRSATNLADIASAAPSVLLRPASAAFGTSVTASIRGFVKGRFAP